MAGATEAAGGLAGAFGKAASAARELNEAIASRPTPQPGAIEDLGEPPG